MRFPFIYRIFPALAALFCFNITANAATPLRGDTVCSVARMLTTLTGPDNGEYRWRHSGETDQIVTVCPVATTTYELVFTDSVGCSTLLFYQIVVAKDDQIPRIVTVTNPSGSNTTAVNLTATASSGAVVDWYDAPRGGNRIASGTNNFSVNKPVVRWAAARNNCGTSVERKAVRAVYTYSHRTSSYPVDLEPGYYDITVYGGSQRAQGGVSGGILPLTEPTTLYVFVGAAGTTSANATVFNGGTATNGGYAGGGATDIRMVNNADWKDIASLRSRILVAGGGGAGTGIAGAGGGLAGADGSGGMGGTQTTGGISVVGGYSAGSFGMGGDGCAGGGGWYGGGGSANANGSGGGSSFASGHPGCVAVNADGTQRSDDTSYTGYVFFNTYLQQGGNSGAGKAVISPVPFDSAQTCSYTGSDLVLGSCKRRWTGAYNWEATINPVGNYLAAPTKIYLMENGIWFSDALNIPTKRGGLCSGQAWYSTNVARRADYCPPGWRLLSSLAEFKEMFAFGVAASSYTSAYAHYGLAWANEYYGGTSCTSNSNFNLWIAGQSGTGDSYAASSGAVGTHGTGTWSSSYTTHLRCVRNKTPMDHPLRCLP